MNNRLGQNDLQQGLQALSNQYQQWVEHKPPGLSAHQLAELLLMAEKTARVEIRELAVALVRRELHPLVPVQMKQP